MEESGDGIEDIAAFEETPKNLGVVAVDKLPPEFPCVCTGDDGEVIAHLKPLEDLVDLGRQEERIAKSEGGSKSHRRIGRDIRCNRGSGAGFPRESKVAFGYLPLRDRGKQIQVDITVLVRS